MSALQHHGNYLVAKMVVTNGCKLGIFTFFSGIFETNLEGLVTKHEALGATEYYMFTTIEGPRLRSRKLQPVLATGILGGNILRSWQR